MNNSRRHSPCRIFIQGRETVRPQPGRGAPPPRGLKAHWLGFLALMLALAISTGCSTKNQEAWTALADRGSGYDFEAVNFNVPPFALAGLLKGRAGSSGDLAVYLEGDGRGVIRGRVSPDPTPSKAMGFELAKSDPAPAVLYLARVGQFQPDQTGKKYQEYWSNKRLSEESVRAASQAIDEAKARVGAQRIHLVGYSGGGGLAVLLAQQRPDVASLVTVAGLLDTGWWVQEKNFQPLTGSLNPADKAMRISHIPQVHFYGKDDSIIPPTMSAHFQSLAPFTNFKRVEVDTNHWRVWPEVWPSLLNQYVRPIRPQGIALDPRMLRIRFEALTPLAYFVASPA